MRRAQLLGLSCCARLSPFEPMTNARVCCPRRVATPCVCTLYFQSNEHTPQPRPPACARRGACAAGPAAFRRPHPLPPPARIAHRSVRLALSACVGPTDCARRTFFTPFPVIVPMNSDSTCSTAPQRAPRRAASSERQSDRAPPLGRASAAARPRLPRASQPRPARARAAPGRSPLLAHCFSPSRQPRGRRPAPRAQNRPQTAPCARPGGRPAGGRRPPGRAAGPPG